jgi:lipid A 3-O-deacylase
MVQLQPVLRVKAARLGSFFAQTARWLVFRVGAMRNQKLGALFVTLWFVTIWSKAADQTSLTTSAEGSSVTLEAPAPSLWEAGVGQGFRSSAQTLTLEAGATYGFAILGSKQAHDLALLSLSYGHMIGQTVGRDRFYRGNWEFRAELFGGAQFAPTSEWVVGLTPHLRYNFATGTRWIPYLDAGAGVTATSIGPPDLSNIFEFNLQASVGVRWFFSDHLALTVDARFLHMSCAGISRPNLGLNGAGGMAGLSWFF